MHPRIRRQQAAAAAAVPASVAGDTVSQSAAAEPRQGEGCVGAEAVSRIATPAEISQTCMIWRKQIASSIDCLLERHNARHVPVGGPPENDRQLSLILARGPVCPTILSGPGVRQPTKRRKGKHDSADQNAIQEVRVLFVFWLPTSDRVGKPVSLDGEGCVINIPNFVKSQEDFNSAEIIHPAIGVKMRRNKDEREKVPESIIRLKQMYESLHEPFTGFEGDQTTCFVCKRDLLDDLIEIYRCPLCLISAHSACTSSLASSIQNMPESKRQKLLNADSQKRFRLEMLPSAMVAATAPALETQFWHVQSVHCRQGSLCAVMLVVAIQCLLLTYTNLTCKVKLFYVTHA